MGIVSTTLSQSNNMKFLLVLAVVAAARAEAEAKPGFVYTTGLHHAPLVYNHLPLAYKQAPEHAAAPRYCLNNLGIAVPCPVLGETVDAGSVERDKPEYAPAASPCRNNLGIAVPCAHGRQVLVPALTACRNNEGIAVPCALPSERDVQGPVHAPPAVVAVPGYPR